MRLAVASPSFSRNPDLRAETLALFPDTRFNDDGARLAGAALAEFLKDADLAIIGLEMVDGALLDACPRLRMVAKYGVGLDNIDQVACRARGVAVGWTGGVNRRSVAELVLAFMLGVSRNVLTVSRLLRDGTWVKDGGRQLSGRTVGIIGLGNTGREVAHLLAPFHCRVLGNDILDMDGWCRENGVIPATKETIWAEAELITLHVPLTPATHRLIDADTLAAMRPEAVVINTSRGPVVDQAALKAALTAGHPAAACLDVFEEEPPADRDFLGLPNLFATAHIGGNAREAVLAMGRSALGHLRRLRDGNG